MKSRISIRTPGLDVGRCSQQCLFLCALLGFLLGLETHAASFTVGPWTPVFKGIELASGQQQRASGGERDVQVLCYRIDLSDPDIRLLTTPRCTNCNLETLSQNTSNFLEEHGLQVAINGTFYNSNGPTDTPLGTAQDVYGLAISSGELVSPADRLANSTALLFTTNNQAVFLPSNSQSASTTGIFTAISGNHPLLVDGANVGVSSPNDLDPRTAIGISADRRYLFLMTIDGRQQGWSEGADFHDTAEWLKRFGASDGLNVDGGGSTTMVRSDCGGRALRLNRSSYVAAYGRERNIGHNFGVYARALPAELKNVSVSPGTTTATITWNTDAPATTQVEYGASPTYGNSTSLDSALTRNHVATIAGLSPGTDYFFRATSSSDGLDRTGSCYFKTVASLGTEEIVPFAKSWTYTTRNLDGVDWKAPGYDDSGWIGSGPGLLYVENNPAVGPKGTALPPAFGQPIPRTYYFRTHFNFTGNPVGTSLTFSNYVDDGAVFYLNGVEVQRIRMPAGPDEIFNNTPADGVPCAGTPQAGDALPGCPDVFVLGGTELASLVRGDNTLAVEVHNYTTGNDLVFGSSVRASVPTIASPQLGLWVEGSRAALYWNGDGFTLQQTSDLSGALNWTDVPGPVTRSPYISTNSATMFYRLRN